VGGTEGNDHRAPLSALICIDKPERQPTSSRYFEYLFDLPRHNRRYGT
jgi:hypothetical protein